MAKFEAKNARVFGVSFDSQKANALFHTLFRFNFPLLCDPERTMGLAYGAASRPGRGGAAKRIGVIIDPQGRVHHYEKSASALRFPKVALSKI